MSRAGAASVTGAVATWHARIDLAATLIVNARSRVLSVEEAVVRRVVLGSLFLVAGCSVAAAPSGAGVCWRMFDVGDGKPTFRVLSKGIDNLESCAVLLEGARMLEGTSTVGAYRGQYIFATDEQITSSKLLTGGRVRVFEAEQRQEVQDGLRILIALENAGAPTG